MLETIILKFTSNDFCLGLLYIVISRVKKLKGLIFEFFFN
jgi:hypothetical protein